MEEAILQEKFPCFMVPNEKLMKCINGISPSPNESQLEVYWGKAIILEENGKQYIAFRVEFSALIFHH